MKLFKGKEKAYNAPASHTGGWHRILEPFTGAWQRNIEWKRKDVLCYHAVFACISLIASDISKLRPRIIEKSGDIWEETDYRQYNVVIKPNDYQNHIRFYESWILSKLIRGNAYILKERSSDRKVSALHVLHPDCVLPVVSDDGQVFYQISQDNLAGIKETGITVPASEIIHDRFNCFFHPLVGLSPLFASGLPAYMGIKMLENSAHTFQNGSRPSGILTVPEAITAERAKELRESWEANYGGENYGKTAVIGGDLKYQALSMNAAETQLVEQLKMTSEMVCSTFHVPPYKIGIGTMPSYNNVEALNLEYYNTAAQPLIESLETCLNEGLGIPENKGVEFDLSGLLRMDTKSQIETLGAGVNKAIYSPNEARKQLNLRPVEGGDTPYLQQQNYSLEALSKRDSQSDPFGGNAQPTPQPEPENTEPQERGFDTEGFLTAFSKEFK